MTTENVQVALLPAKSVALQPTTVLPAGKLDPEVKLHPLVLTWMLSVALKANVIGRLAPVVDVALMVELGQVMTGEIGSYS